MAVKPLDKYDYWVATIDWKAPHKWHRRDKFYGAGVDLDEEFQNAYGIYRFERRFQKLSKGKELTKTAISKDT